MAGEITNGGLVAIRSNLSPATGSKSEPSRTSTLSTPLSAALRRVIRRARALTSVATTVSAVVGEVQRLDAAAGAEVERPAHRLADRSAGPARSRRD